MANTAIKRKYKRPAIKEAIFEAKFDYDGFDAAVPGQIFEQIRADYPNKQDIKHQLVFLEREEINKGNQNLLIQAPLMRAIRSDNSELLQFGPGIAVANRLKYSAWEDFIPAIKTIVNAYVHAAKPKILSRVGMRYINSFLTSEETINIADYFNVGIQVPDELASLDGFDLTLSNKIKLTHEQDDSVFNIRTKFLTDALKPGETGNRFILDIDCYISLEINPEINRIVLLATQAHDILSKIFENIITDKIRAILEVE